jgi:hypothetical protein
MLQPLSKVKNFAQDLVQNKATLIPKITDHKLQEWRRCLQRDRPVVDVKELSLLCQ